MSNQTAIKLFENTCAARSASRKVRSVWDAEAEKWYISVVDVIEVLTESNRPRKYYIKRDKTFFLLTLTGLSTLSGHTANDLSGYEVADRVDENQENR